jgi:hypothetical protein
MFIRSQIELITTIKFLDIRSSKNNTFLININYTENINKGDNI